MISKIAVFLNIQQSKAMKEREGMVFNMRGKIRFTLLNFILFILITIPATASIDGTDVWSTDTYSIFLVSFEESIFANDTVALISNIGSMIIQYIGNEGIFMEFNITFIDIDNFLTFRPGILKVDSTSGLTDEGKISGLFYDTKDFVVDLPVEDFIFEFYVDQRSIEVDYEITMKADIGFYVDGKINTVNTYRLEGEYTSISDNFYFYDRFFMSKKGGVILHRTISYNYFDVNGSQHFVNWSYEPISTNRLKVNNFFQNTLGFRLTDLLLTLNSIAALGFLRKKKKS